MGPDYIEAGPGKARPGARFSPLSRITLQASKSSTMGSP